jgi:predicted MFS family arabinose efflux permease
MDFMVIVPLGAKCREELSITPAQFSHVVGAYGISAAVAGLLAASFIDRLDRKIALLCLYAGFTVGTLLCAAAPDYWSLVLARAVAGGFGGISGAVILVIIGDAFPEMRRGRATGVVMTAFSLASIAGLPAGIVLGNRFGVRTPFGVLGILGIAICVLAYRVLPRLRGHLDHGRRSGETTWTVLTQPAHIRAYTFMIMLVMGTFTIAPHFGDYVVHNVGRPPNDLAYVYFFGGLLTFVTLPLVGRWADRFGKRVIFQIMAVCTLLTLLVMTNLPATSLAPLLVLTTLYFIFTSGRWVPAMAMITSSALPSYRGKFMSLNASVQQMAMFLGTEVAGVVIREGANHELTGYSLAGIIAAVSTVISLRLASRLRVAQEIPEASTAVDPLDETPVLSSVTEVENMTVADDVGVAQEPAR